MDGVFAITHKGGCGLPFEGLDHQILERVLAGFARHPNVAAYVIVGLGCEGAYAQHLVETQHLTLAGSRGNGAGRNQPTAPHGPRVLNIQDEGGITKTVEAAVRAVHDLLPEANAWRRTEQPASKLCLAMECGGSDGNSGVTANPALGVAADLVIAQGGTAVLGETTEIYGAEHLLTRRAVTRAVGEKLVERIKWWEWYTGVFGARIDNNPSPGNKAGGLTTIYEKSLGRWPRRARRRWSRWPITPPRRRPPASSSWIRPATTPPAPPDWSPPAPMCWSSRRAGAACWV